MESSMHTHRCHWAGIYILVLASLLLSRPVYSQSYTIKDSTMALGLVNAGLDTMHISPARSLQLAEQGLKISKEIGFAKGIAAGEWTVGYASYLLNDINNALKHYTEALSADRQYKFQRQEGRTLYTLSQFYHGIGDQKKAFEYGEASLNIAIARNDSSAIADNYSALGIILASQNMYDDATKYYHKSVDIYHKTGATKNEAIIIHYIGINYLSQEKYKEAYSYFLKSLKLYETPEAYSDLGNYYAQTENDDSALFYFNRELEIFRKKGDKLSTAIVLDDIGRLQTKRGELVIAEKNLKESFALAKEISYLETIARSQDDLANLYDKKHDYKKANEYHVATSILKDSLSNIQLKEKIAELNAKFEVKEIEDKNTSLQSENNLQKLKLQRKNILIAGTISVLVTSLVIGILLFRQSKLKANQQKTDLEQKQLRAQMNPHFIFNCLNSIQHFIVANDVKNANKYLSGFALLMRQTLENSKDGVITLRREIAYLENYLVLERMRFEDKFTYEIDCAEDINIDRMEIPSMIIQPFIENAIRHGLCYLEGRQGKLRISFYTKGGYLCCEVDDNGIGREQSQKLKMVSDVVYESHGMELTRRRLALVSKSSGSEYKIEITDKKNEMQEAEGTMIIIKFPLDV